MPSPDLLVIAWNARICGSEVVMKELHIVWTIHDGLIRQLDNLAWTRRLGLGELVLCMFEYIWVPADDYLVFSHDAAQQPIGYLRARLSQFAQDGHVSWHYATTFRVTNGYSGGEGIPLFFFSYKRCSLDGSCCALVVFACLSGPHCVC